MISPIRSAVVLGLAMALVIALSKSLDAGHAAAEPATQPAAADLALTVARKHGLDAWPRVDTLGFTFNVHTQKRQVKRQWLWRVADGEVTRTTDAGQVTFKPDQVNDQSNGAVKAAHREFINDSYWLLFPLQLAWSQPQLTLVGQQPAPLSGQPTTRLDAGYTTGGYTPGDTYRLFLTPDHFIHEWTFVRPGNDPRHFTWESRASLGPLTVYLDHHGQNPLFRLFFTDLTLTLKDDPRTLTPATQPRSR